MVQTRYIQQWYPLAIYLGDAEDKRKKHGKRREEEKGEKRRQEDPYKGAGGARALVVALAPREDNTQTTKQTQAVTSPPSSRGEVLRVYVHILELYKDEK